MYFSQPTIEPMKSVPHRHDLMVATLQALNALGGSGTNDEIREEVIQLLSIPDEVANLPYATRRGTVDGRSALEYGLAWARTYLSQMGYLMNSSRGVWAITPEGSHPDAFSTLVKTKFDISGIEHPSDWKQDLLGILRKQLSPPAFERLVQRMLRETGFDQVEVTGRSGDGGIDGKGIAKINGILSFRVVFQCKRYTGAVSPSEIRDFRGAMQGRADKGLFITTGYFTREAIRESVRDGALAIDLVDGDKLAIKLKSLGLGVKVEQVEKIALDPDWFSSL